MLLMDVELQRCRDPTTRPAKPHRTRHGPHNLVTSQEAFDGVSLSAAVPVRLRGGWLTLRGVAMSWSKVWRFIVDASHVYSSVMRFRDQFLP